MEPWFKVSSEGPEKWGISLAIPGLVVQCVIHYTTTAPPKNGTVCFYNTVLYPKDASGMANIIRPGLEEKWGIDLAIPGLVVQCVIQKMNCCNNCWHFNIYEQ